MTEREYDSWDDAPINDDEDLLFPDIEDDYDDPYADAEALASAGFGTDEDYGYYGDDQHYQWTVNLVPIMVIEFTDGSPTHYYELADRHPVSFYRNIDLEEIQLSNKKAALVKLTEEEITILRINLDQHKL